MAELVCVSCGRGGRRDNGTEWYEGSVWEIALDPDDAAIENGVYLCGDCYCRIDPEDRPRWKPLPRTAGLIREQTGG